MSAADRFGRARDSDGLAKSLTITLFALLELYKQGEADWEQGESFGEIAVRASSAQAPLLGVARAGGAAG
jgi:chromatin segregation and condensation protein Rec8/ScpA/Scc1 (kleisin family)